MLEVWKTTHPELPSLDLFYQVWWTQFPHLKNPKNCRLGQYDVCADLQVKLTKAQGQIRQQLLTKQQKHKADVHLERKKMDELLDRGHTDPENWTCLATDWSNPHFMPQMGNSSKRMVM
jgi:hypothetical protein